jgi:hypothetical protein
MCVCAGVHKPLAQVRRRNKMPFSGAQCVRFLSTEPVSCHPSAVLIFEMGHWFSAKNVPSFLQLKSPHNEWSYPPVTPPTHTGFHTPIKSPERVGLSEAVHLSQPLMPTFPAVALFVFPLRLLYDANADIFHSCSKMAPVLDTVYNKIPTSLPASANCLCPWSVDMRAMLPAIGIWLRGSESVRLHCRRCAVNRHCECLQII